MRISDVPRETYAQLERYVDLLLAENGRQNLIGRSTEASVWQRHIADSLQLIPYATADGRWTDIGSGAGLPGLVAAIVRPEQEVILIEPRPLRAAFLERTIKDLSLARVSVVAQRAEAIPSLESKVISARAVASLTSIFSLGLVHAGPDCRWLLPKGRRVADELVEARQTWQGTFTLIPSNTDPEAAIIMARDVRPLVRSRKVSR